MRLCVGPPGHRQPDQLHGRRELGAVLLMLTEHDRTDLDSPHPAVPVQLDRQGLGGILRGGDLGQEGLGVQVHSVAPGRLNDGDSRPGHLLGQIGSRADPVLQVLLLKNLGEALGDRLQVVSGQTPVGRETLGEDQQVPALPGDLRVVHPQESADVGKTVLLGRHGAPVDQGEHLPGDLAGGPVGVARLTLLDEPGVLGKPAGIQEERQTVSVADLAHLPQVGQADRLPAPRVVGHRDHDQRYPFAPHLSHRRLQRRRIHVALERILRGRVPPLRHHQVASFGAPVLHVGAGGVEVGVVGNDVAGLHDGREEDLLGGPSLMGGDDLGEAGQLLDGVAEAVEGPAPGVRLVAVHHPRPLLRGHRSGAGVGEQVDDHLVAVQTEQVVAHPAERLLPLGPVGEGDGLDCVDPERLDDRPVRHGGPFAVVPAVLQSRKSRCGRGESDQRVLVGRLHRQHRALGVEENLLGVAPQDQLADLRTAAQTDHDQVGSLVRGGLYEILGR